MMRDPCEISARMCMHDLDLPGGKDLKVVRGARPDGGRGHRGQQPRVHGVEVPAWPGQQQRAEAEAEVQQQVDLQGGRGAGMGAGAQAWVQEQAGTLARAEVWDKHACPHTSCSGLTSPPPSSIPDLPPTHTHAALSISPLRTHFEMAWKAPRFCDLPPIPHLSSTAKTDLGLQPRRDTL